MKIWAFFFCFLFILAKKEHVILGVLDVFILEIFRDFLTQILQNFWIILQHGFYDDLI